MRWTGFSTSSTPHTKRECWILTAYKPEDDDEQDRLDKMTSELGFAPTEKAHRLTAATSGAKKNAKRVLGELTEGKTEREDDAIKNCYPKELEKAGEDVSLKTFIGEVRKAINKVMT